MAAVDFEEWAAPGMRLTLGGRTYIVPPPSVAAARQILAAAVRAEVNLGIAEGPVPTEVQAVLDTIGDGHPALGPVFDQLVEAGAPAATIDRMSYYAVFYWARGKAFADGLAEALWAPRDGDESSTGKGGEGAGPKGS